MTKSLTSIRPTLPIDSHLPTLVSELATKGALILQAEPGAGKTTRLPPALLSCTNKQVVVLEPRRLAAKLAATHIAAEMATPLGATVGYRVRHEAKSSAATRLLFVTEGLFLRLLLADPMLAQIGIVVLDEFHERQLHSDLALAALKLLQQTVRPDLKICIMSATLEVIGLQNYLPHAAFFHLKGRVHPVVTDYLPPLSGEELISTVKRAACKMHSDPRCSGDILIFMTGIADIRRAAGAITNALPDCEILPLTAELSHTQQEKVFRPNSKRKIILATNVAETSITIPGITGVIDTGLAKQAGHAAWNGLPTLDIKKVSQASCIQRTGRGGRTAPGLCFRLFSEADFFARPRNTLPEIKRLDLAQMLLEVRLLAEKMHWPASDNLKLLPWFEPPDAAIFSSAEQILKRLGALETTPLSGDLALTTKGRAMADWPLHPRLAAVAVAGKENGIPRAALLAACLISEGFLFSRGFQAADMADCDLKYQMQLLLQMLLNQEVKPRVVAESLDIWQVRKIQRLYETLAKEPAQRVAQDLVNLPAAKFAACLLAGFPDRLAKRRYLKKEHESRRHQLLFNFCLGRGGQLAPGSVCRDADFIVAIDASEAVTTQNAAQGITIWAASAVTATDVLQLNNDLMKVDDVCTWNDAAERVDACTRRLYGQIVLTEERTIADAALIEETLRTALHDRWPKPFTDAADLSTYHARRQMLDQAGIDHDLPLFEGDMFELLLATICEGKRSFKDVASQSLEFYVRAQLTYVQQQLLDEAVPLTVRLNNGKEINVHYERDQPPKVVAFIQDFYGVTEGPKILRGRLPLSLQLVGPNRHPLQVTKDLRGFWQTMFPALRQELSRHYPRWHWAAEPTTAPPVLLKKHLS